MITYSKAIEATYESADLIPAVKLGGFCHCLRCFVTHFPRQVIKAYKDDSFFRASRKWLKQSTCDLRLRKNRPKRQNSFFFVQNYESNFIAVSPLVSFGFCS